MDEIESEASQNQWQEEAKSAADSETPTAAKDFDQFIQETMAQSGPQEQELTARYLYSQGLDAPYLYVRHAQSEGNRNYQLYGDVSNTNLDLIDANLSEEGLQ